MHPDVDLSSSKPLPLFMDKGEVNNNFKATSNGDLVTKVGVAALIPLAGAMSWLAAASTFITAVALVGTCFIVTLAESILFGFWENAEEEKEIGASETILKDGGYKVGITNTFDGPVKITAKNGKIENRNKLPMDYLKGNEGGNFIILDGTKECFAEELHRLTFRHEKDEMLMEVTIECGEKRKILPIVATKPNETEESGSKNDLAAKLATELN